MDSTPAPSPSDYSASQEALAKLQAAAKAQKGSPELLNKAIRAVRRGDWQAAATFALKLLKQTELNGTAWWVLGICREAASDFRGAIQCYECALKLLPEHTMIANDLGRLAHRLGELATAEQLFRHFLAGQPGHPEGTNNLACVLRDQHRFEEAIELVRGSLGEDPSRPILWNTLATILNQRGDLEQAIVFYDEALRLDPGFARARYNKGNARLTMGEAAGALADLEAALETPVDERDGVQFRLARALALLANGRIAEGWDAYEIRHHRSVPRGADFAIGRPLWSPTDDICGKSMLVVGEQGLGDEVMFAQVLPEVLAALGPDGRLTLAVESRLVELFARSFPKAEVVAHRTAAQGARNLRHLPTLETLESIDCWTPMGGLLRRWRSTPEAFVAKSYLTPSPERVNAWRSTLAGLGGTPKVGILWKSLRVDTERTRLFSPFEQWEPVLRTPGVQFVNLQYGDCSAELELAERAGVPLWTPPGLDLRNDLSEVAALTCALDLVVGPANATLNLGAASGAPVWLIATPGAWTRLGQEGYPWYPQARVFTPARLNDWRPLMDEVAQALQSEFQPADRASRA